MVEEKKAVKKTAGGKSASSASVKAPAESAVWPFPAVEKKPAKAPAAKKPAAKAAAEPAAKKPAAKKPAAKAAEKPAAKAAEKPAAKPAAKKAPRKAAAKTAPSAQERYMMVQTAAYFIAERAGFQGCSTDHWAAAEVEIAQKLGD